MGVRIRIVELLHRYSVNLVLSDQTGELPRRLSLQRTEAPQRCMPEAVTLPRHAPPVDGATSGGRWGRLGRPGWEYRGWCIPCLRPPKPSLVGTKASGHSHAHTGGGGKLV